MNGNGRESVFINMFMVHSLTVKIQDDAKTGAMHLTRGPLLFSKSICFQLLFYIFFPKIFTINRTKNVHLLRDVDNPFCGKMLAKL